MPNEVSNNLLLKIVIVYLFPRENLENILHRKSLFFCKINVAYYKYAYIIKIEFLLFIMIHNILFLIRYKCMRVLASYQGTR